MENFLDNLKESLETGNFNSEAAKKINAVDDLADDVKREKTIDEMEDSIMDKATEGGVKTVDSEDIGKIQSEYEEKMKARAAEEIFLADIARLMNRDEEIDKIKEELREDIFKAMDAYPKSDEYQDIYTMIDHLVEKYGFEV